MSIAKKNHIQSLALSAWINSNKKKATCKMCQGTGKSALAYKWLYYLLDTGKILKNSETWMFSLTTFQGENLKKEFEKYDKIKGNENGLGRNVFKDFNLIFKCYAGIPQGDPKVCIFDEVDSILSKEYMKNLEKGEYALGLTGTETKNKNVFKENLEDGVEFRQSDLATEKGEVTVFINKGQLLEIKCPVVYEYTFEEAKKDGLITPIETTLIYHNLGDNMVRTWKSYNTLSTEKEYYNKRMSQIRSYHTNAWRKKAIGMELTKFLYNLPSKIPIIKHYLKELKGQTLVFGRELPLLKMSCENVLDNLTSSFTIPPIFYTTKKTKRGIKYLKKHLLRIETKEITKKEFDKAKLLFKASFKKNKELLESFNKQEINHLASSKLIGRGLTLPKVDNGLFASYASTNTSLSQWAGRIWRMEDRVKTAKLFFIITQNTYEERWFDKLQKIFDGNGDYETMDLNITKEIEWKPK